MHDGVVLLSSGATLRVGRRLKGQIRAWGEAAWARGWLPLEDKSVTSQEEQMLNSLVERVNATQLPEKDPDAAALLERGFSANRDAVYVLAQSVLVQNIALEQARAQLTAAQDQLKQQAQQPARSGSFLGNLLHRDPAPPQQQYQPVYTPQAAPEYQTPYNPGPPPPGYGGPGYQGAPYGGPAYGGPQYGPPPGSAFGQGSFLRGAAQTAAGVAAGALAFEGVEALLHGGFGHPGMGMGMGGWGMPGVGFGMGPGMGMGYERPMEETIVNNNYYDSPGGGQGDFGRDEHFHDGGGGQMQDASWGDDSGSGFDSGSGGGSDFGGGGDFGDSGGGSDFGGGGDFGDSGGGSGGDSGGF